MRFSRLRLNGFKSFVDPTDLIIADGLTGVVGPNGCGKSNLLEALRWVMGENRPTAMRGGGMEDVIFAGAATRGARNFAEVSLHIDNQDRLAPAGFNDLDQLEIIRRITRDIGSAYKTNGKDVRARDVQMLFADASTGAHSPALVRQGQISELINAKPKARRRILEEAAGISGLYQRRHEAELKLKGAETNLTRVDDVIEQLAGQLGSLARQAKQARRYKEIGADLRHAEGLLLYGRWKEATATLIQAQERLRERTTATAQTERAALEATTARDTADAAVPPLREEEAIAAAILQRLTVQRDTITDQQAQAKQQIESLTAQIAQMGQDIEREAALNADATDTIAKLTSERDELATEGEGHEAALAAAVQAATAAAQVLKERESTLAQKQEDAARLAARHQSAQRFHTEAEQRVAKTATEAEDSRAKVTTAQAEAAQRAEAFAQAEANQARIVGIVEEAERTLTQTEAARATSQAAEVEARTLRSERQGEVNALQAEVGSLRKLVDRSRGTGALILDQISVSPGFEKALGAALADDLKAPIVNDAASGWRVLSPYGDVPTLPAGVASLASHVQAPPALARRLSQIGIVSADQAAVLHPDLQPGQRLVSTDGDVWRWDGYQARAKDAPSAAAAQLEQQNRLARLEMELTGLQALATEATAAHEAVQARLTDLTKADQQAREARRDADRMQADAGRAVSRAEAELALAEGRIETLNLSVARLDEEGVAARAQMAEAVAALADLGDLDAARAEVNDILLTVEAARVTMLSRRAAKDEIRRAGDARERRAGEIRKELSTWTHRLDTAQSRATELSDRMASATDQLELAQARPAELEAERETLGDALREAEARRAAGADALSSAETALRACIGAERDAERAASDAREARARAEGVVDAAKESVEAAAERIEEEQDCSPQSLLTQLDLDPDQMPHPEQVEADVIRLRRQRDALGAVNLRAEEDSVEVQTEHDALVSEKSDLEAAIATLRSGIASLNKEGRERLLAAFDEVNRNFGTLFTHLFGGGEAQLTLVESDDPLEAGLEILCQPPGKKLSTLSLLSGGEQTLTALALIFAVFLANPAPICVLDEVDAPLDDANVTRFCDLLDEMTRRTNTRFLIITHHAVTMARMDRLFGVTMAEQGVSQLVSVDLNKAEKLVA